MADSDAAASKGISGHAVWVLRFEGSRGGVSRRAGKFYSKTAFF
jgi:hypothetical protein